MRRQDREMSRDFALHMVDKCEYAVLSMVDEQNFPYCVPITIVREQEKIYFHCAQEGKKVDVLKKHPQVCLACVGETKRALHKFTTEYESAVVQGTATEVTSEQEKIQALRLLCERHTPTNMDDFEAAMARSLFHTAVWSIAIQSITGKRKKYDTTGKEMKFGRME